MLHYFERKIEKTTFQLSKYGQLLVHFLDNAYPPNTSPKVPLNNKASSKIAAKV
jgi:hypothetical protein